jgi:hypothetical protein
MLWSVEQDDEATVLWLVEPGIYANVHNETWKAPLHVAVSNRWETCVKLLLRRGTAMRELS